MSDVAVLVPVLGRPERVEPLLRSLERSQGDATLEMVFLASPNDHDEWNALRAVQATFLVVPWEPGLGDWAKKINLGYRETNAPWLFTGADDLDFHHGWADEALRVAKAKDALVVGTNDLGNARVTSGQHATHSLVSRGYADAWGTVDGTGEVVSEVYSHNFVDDELVGTAKARGLFAFAAGSVVEHLHPHWQKGEWDETYVKGQADFGADRQVFLRRERLWQRIAA